MTADTTQNTDAAATETTGMVEPSGKRAWVQFTLASLLVVAGLAAVAGGLITGNTPMVVAGAVTALVGYGWFVVKNLADPIGNLFGIFYIWP